MSSAITPAPVIVIPSPLCPDAGFAFAALLRLVRGGSRHGPCSVAES
jgi:hypothetical protein